MVPARRYALVTTRPEPARALESMLSGPQAAVLRLESEKSVLDAVKQAVPTGVFLDADDPRCGAVALCRRLRGLIHPAAGLLILFGRRLQGAELVGALDHGADDYWSYPFNEPVCLAYLRAILRRLSPVAPAGAALEADGLRADPAERRALLRGKPLNLRAKEFDLLCFFLRQRGKALSREDLMANVWGREYFGTTRTIDFHIAQLRRKLGSWSRWLETLPGMGYRCSAGSRAEPDRPSRPGKGR